MYRKSGRKGTSTSKVCSRVSAAASKKDKQQHLEVLCTPVPIGSTVVNDASISTPTIDFPFETVNSITATHSLYPIIAPTKSPTETIYQRCLPCKSSNHVCYLMRLLIFLYGIRSFCTNFNTNYTGNW